MLPEATRARVGALPRVRAVALPSLAWSFLITSVALGALIRLRPVAAVDFPLNDGGMFYTIVQDIEAAGGALPATLSYNALQLPFAYPPLAFYAAALANGAGLALADVFRVLPVIFASLCVIAFARLALRLLGDVTLAAIATFAFAVVPASYTWLVMGGGLTRGLGLFFALVTLERLATYFETRSRLAQVVAAIAAGLCVLSHLEMAWVMTFGAVIIWASRGRTRSSFTGALVAGLGGAVVALPWLAVSVARHGTAPFLSASGTGSLDNPVIDLAIFRQTDEPWFAIVAALAVVGMIASVGARRWLLPAWVVCIGILDSRSFGIVSAVPISMLAAIAVRDVLAPLVPSLRMRVALAALGVTYALMAVAQTSPDLLLPIPQADRDAMAWARGQTAADARFLVITERGWAENAPAEWFPALAKRASVSTVQGYEWVPDGGFWKQLRLFFAAQSCGSQNAACVAAFRATWTSDFQYVYLPDEKYTTRQDATDQPCCTGLREALLRDPGYELVYREGDAVIFRVR